MGKRIVINDRTRKIRAGLLLLLILIGIGYAVIRSGLNINGTTHVHSASWDVHFENYQAASGSVTPIIEPSTTGNPTTVTYEVTLTNPGDYYEFTIDAVNNGTLDAMIESFSSKIGDTEITPSTLPPYLSYSATYSDGVELQNKQQLLHNTRETLKLKIAYRDDIPPTDLPSTVQDLSLSFTITYVQDDGTSVPVRPGFATMSWDEIIDAVNNNELTQLQKDMVNGTTRAVPLDLDLDGTSDATCDLRIANLSTPAECSTQGFSQTACGLVLECANVIENRRMTPETPEYQYGYNVGGWPATELRTYLNNETPGVASMYNALPSELRSKLISTTVVSGYGCSDYNKRGHNCNNHGVGENYTSTDKIYLLSTKEVWGKEGTSNIVNQDSAEAETRQLDYYSANNVTTSNYSGAVKPKDGINARWRLRSPSMWDNFDFYLVGSYDSFCVSCGDGQPALDGTAKGAYGISPAFRIGKTS